MISPLRKANDTPISLATPWSQTHVPLANRKRRQRTFESAVRTNVRNAQSDTSVAYCLAVRSMSGVRWRFAGSMMYCEMARQHKTSFQFPIDNKYDNESHCVFDSYAFISRFVLNFCYENCLWLHISPVVVLDDWKNVMSVNQLLVDIFLCSIQMRDGNGSFKSP